MAGLRSRVGRRPTGAAWSRQLAQRPTVAPDLYPIDPEVPIDRRTQHKWHVNGDGSLCLMQAADVWQPENTAADLVRKAAGWYIEYLLVDGGDLDHMTERGIYISDEIDALLEAKFG
jgi:hypothetical protein